MVFAGSVSCVSMFKDSYLHSFERFVAKVEKEYKSYSKDDWDRNDKKLIDFENKCDKYSKYFTKEDKKLIVKLKMKYMYLKGKSNIEDFLGEFEDYIDFEADATEEFLDEINNQN